MVLAGEVGGRFSDEIARKSPGSPSVAAKSSARGVATTVECYAGVPQLVLLHSHFWTRSAGVDGPTPSMHEVLGDSRHFLWAAEPLLRA